MKRTLLTICALAALAAASWAQVTFPSATIVYSLQSQRTDGLLTNEIDQSFTANADFGSVANPFLLAGVFGNPELLDNNDTSSYFDAGYYQSGSTPFSVYGSFYATSTGIAQTPSVTQWSSTTYAAPSVRTFRGMAQGLFKLGGITAGLAVGYNPSTNATANAAYSTTATTTTSGGNADYTTTTTLNNMSGTGPLVVSGANNTYSSTAFAIPVYLKTGDLEHSAFIGVSLKGRDNSGTASLTTTAYKVTAGTTVTDIDASIDSSTNQTGFEGNYVLSMPGFFGKDKGNKFSAGIDITDAIISSAYSYSYKTTTYDVSTIGSKTQTATATTTAAGNYANLNYLKIAAMAKHSFNFVPADGFSFGLTPQIVASYDNNPSNAYSGSNQITGTATLVSTTSTVGGVSTTTQTANDTRTNLSGVEVGLNIPTAFKIKPDSWPFGLYGGATPYATFTWTTTEVAYYTTNTLANSGSTTVFTAGFGEDHVFGIFVPFGNGVRADVAMNGSNLLDFDALTLQVIIPLK